MREIKFRIWNITLQRMSKSKTIQELIETAIYEEKRGLKVSENYSNLIFMQYTGLEDKNSKEIYEGDVVKLIEELEDEEHNFHQVVFEDSGYFTLKPHIDSGDFIPTLGYFTNQDVNDRYYTVEIIGNIYENPDLAGNEETASKQRDAYNGRRE